MQGEPGPPASVPVALGLNHTEELILARLTRQSCISKEQICGIQVSGHRTIRLSSVNGIVGGLRRKLASHGIKLATVNGFGFELRRKDRAKVLELLAAQMKGSQQPGGDGLVRKSDPQGRMGPETSQTRSDAA